jgi:hypothetical protein
MSAKGKGPAASQVIREILHYLTEHPDAKDTVEGILRWWLPKGGVERGEEEVREVLGSLVSRGWLTERGTTPSQKIYGMNRDRLEEIRRFLQEPGNKG